MKVLFISNEIGIEAPGIVYEKLISNLGEKCDITIYSPQIKLSTFEVFRTIYNKLPHISKLPYLWARALFVVFGENFLGWLWANKCFNIISRQQSQADIVITAISSNNCETLYLGRKISKALGAKWVVYSVDAIPAPLGWSRNNSYYRSLKRFISKKTCKADAFFSSNPVMVDYQKSCLSEAFHGYVGFVYTPFSFRMCTAPDTTKDPVFLYTGSVYGLRHVDTLMEAFSVFVKKWTHSKMIFVGDIDKAQFKEYEYLIKQGNLLIVGYTDNLDIYYSESTILLDLSADIPNDVFLSSKIINYLPLQRPIISIGGQNSVASAIFKNDASIIISSYQTDNILEALNKSLEANRKPCSNRKKYMEEMSDNAVAEKFYQDLVLIKDNK